MFGSPAVVRNVGRYGAKHNVELPSLKRVISAGAPANTSALQDLTRMLARGVEIHTPLWRDRGPARGVHRKRDNPWGNSAPNRAGRGEPASGFPCARTASKSFVSRTILSPSGRTTSKWPRARPVRSPSGAPVVTQSYYNRPEATALAKIVAPGEGGVYHRMGDVGYFDAEGRLWYCGRKKPPRGDG